MKKPLDLKSLLIAAGKELRASFDYQKTTSSHAGTQGQAAEDILIDFLNERLPKRFSSSSGFVVDFQGSISKQCDVIIYDALNSPIYKPSSKGLIVLSDNAAGAIEVKSTLDKQELKKAAENIASVKRLKKSPITNMDEPVTFSSFVNTKTYGVVFAYDSSTSLEALAHNLKEINKNIPSSEWIDLIVVLDKGVIGYTVQNPFEADKQDWFGGASDDAFPPPPYYIHLVKADLGELALNKFFVSLLAHLTFYRKRVGFDLDGLMGPESKQILSINAYQYNLSKNLVDITEDHIKENFTMPLRYNLFRRQDKKFLGQIGRKSWQDGAMISYSGFIRPDLIFSLFVMDKSAVFVEGLKNGRHWISSIIPLTEQEFEDISSNINQKIPEIISQKDIDDGSPMTAVTYREKK
jgi:hypothetical protein